ncbi:hypothetical protein PFISCL1PPCAC_25469, partial [Pristionchus fissidentatus]
GPCDRAAAYLKRTILGWNESGKDSHTPKELFDALTENTPKVEFAICSKYSFLSQERIIELTGSVLKQSHVYSRIKDTILDVAIKEFAIAIETEECAKLAVNQSEIIKDRGDKNTHTQGWSLKESRASRMDAHVQAVAMKFFLDHRAEDKRANAAECCELIKNRMDSRNDYFQFPLSLCPSEKTLMSSFGSWETKRRR